jgi:aminoglycoside phosphotransferase (APT) family kinase protein
VPAPEADDAAPGGPRFPQLARAMGELLAAFRRLPSAGLQVDELWADPGRLARSAASWADQAGIAGADRCIAGIPALFAGRPAVLAHGDFAPVNVLTDGTAVTGLLDFEAVRLADPLFDAAWWAWSVSFAPAGVLDAAWPAFLEGAGLDAAEPGFADRIRALQVARMLEQLATGSLEPGIARIVTGRLHATLSVTGPGGAPPSP